ncbi:uncharacterized protein B0H18DRAFT_999326 [Fomitopsis serialis]|uniref:uncharacterized protein n=1 Tax=Fomitopsis serialis TaxID=139415 RepID=UPI002007A80D|nr:uncharacterized protein B0H18DRAFT_999326 [Neoantrodia serialis]KAH9928912.1 hypothetical protein B0H18DRAFT_999326 [Neoantrodia serialis]
MQRAFGMCWSNAGASSGFPQARRGVLRDEEDDGACRGFSVRHWYTVVRHHGPHCRV